DTITKKDTDDKGADTDIEIPFEQGQGASQTQGRMTRRRFSARSGARFAVFWRLHTLKKTHGRCTVAKLLCRQSFDPRRSRQDRSNAPLRNLDVGETSK